MFLNFLLFLGLSFYGADCNVHDQIHREEMVQLLDEVREQDPSSSGVRGAMAVLR
jgi:hypothetical protein